MDDIILTGDDEAEISAVKAYLDDTFRIKDLGEARYFLGMEILPVAEGLILTQRKFAKEVLEEFLDPNATSVICPLDCTQRLAADQ